MDILIDRQILCHLPLITCRLPQVTATNQVSALTEDFNVTVDRLQPMANLSVRGVPDVVPQGSTQTLTTSVLLDMSVAATVRCEQGTDQTCGEDEGVGDCSYPSSFVFFAGGSQAMTAAGASVEVLGSFEGFNGSDVQ